METPVFELSHSWAHCSLREWLSVFIFFYGVIRFVTSHSLARCKYLDIPFPFKCPSRDLFFFHLEVTNFKSHQIIIKGSHNDFYCAFELHSSSFTEPSPSNIKCYWFEQPPLKSDLRKSERPAAGVISYLYILHLRKWTVAYCSGCCFISVPTPYCMFTLVSCMPPP